MISDWSELFVFGVYVVFFLAALFGALMVVLTPHAVHAALYLVLVMVAIAGLFVLVNAQLAAAFQVIVYAGAIMVLFLFVIMLLNVGRQPLPSPRTRTIRWLGGLLSAAFALQMGALAHRFLAPAVLDQPARMDAIRIDEVARVILIDYLYAFEMTSILLLIAVAGAVVLARRRLDGGVAEPPGGAKG